jgi:protein arginine N-methyltransferase 2
MLRAVLESTSSSSSYTPEEPEASADPTDDPALSSASDNATFLKTKLRFETVDDHERCLDAEGNVVMAGWETNIMRETARKLCQDLDGDGNEGISVLNVGFGLGIVSSSTPR